MGLALAMVLVSRRIEARAHDVGRWCAVRYLLREELGEGVDVKQVHFGVACMGEPDFSWQEDDIVATKSCGLAAYNPDDSACKHQ